MTETRCPHKDAVGQQCLRVAGHPNYINYETKLPLIDGAHDMGGVTPDSYRAWQWIAMAKETEIVISDQLLWAFYFHYHRDKMNAAVHCAPARFSALTIRLCLGIEEEMEKLGKTWAEVGEIEGFSEVRQTLMTHEATVRRAMDKGDGG